MKLVKPSFEILEQKPKEIVIPDDMEIGPRMVKEELLNSIYRQIEIAGRTCYKSEDKMNETVLVRTLSLTISCLYKKTLSKLSKHALKC